MAGKHSKEAPEGVSPPVVGGMAWPYFSFYQSLRPYLCCFAALSSTRAPQPCLSPSSGSAAASFGRKAHRWSARGHHAPGCSSHLEPLMMATIRTFCLVWWRPEVSGARLLQGVFCRRRVSSVVLLPTAEYVLDVFQLVFNRMYLIVCYGLALAWSLHLSTDCDRLHSARRGLYLNAEAHFCWLSLFVATINMFWVLR
jgi:hypothetical protein